MISLRVAVASLVLASIAGCGSRSGIDLFGSGASGGAGAGGGTSTSTTTSSSTSTSSSTTTTTSGAATCDALSTWPAVVLPDLGRRPQLAALPGSNDVLLGVVAPGDAPYDFLTLDRVVPFAAWPPTIETSYGDWVTPVDDFAMGPGPDGPVALLYLAGASLNLLTTMVPDVSEVPLTPFGNADTLFAAGIPGRYLAAQVDKSNGYASLSIVSYQPGGLPQTEGPHVCISSAVDAAAVPSGTGFLTALVEVDPPANNCAPATPFAGTRLSVKRYESPPEAGSFLQLSDGDGFSTPEPIFHLAMAQAAFGAWVVFQTDGSISEQMPAIVATAVDATGHVLPGTPAFFSVSPEGIAWPHLAAATVVGDALALAYVDTVDPSAPTILIQIARPDGTLGPATSIPTNGAWLTGRVELQASPDRRSLLVAWEAAQDQPRIALARVDCVNGL